MLQWVMPSINPGFALAFITFCPGSGLRETGNGYNLHKEILGHYDGTHPTAWSYPPPGMACLQPLFSRKTGADAPPATLGRHSRFFRLPPVLQYAREGSGQGP